MKSPKVPGFVLSTWLFLFFYLLLRTAFSEIPQTYYNLSDAIVVKDGSIVQYLVLAFLYIVWLFLSFWSIIRMLKGKADCVSSIRWMLVVSLVISFSYLVQALGKAIMIHWSFVLPSLIKIVLIVGFLVYLAKSRYIKEQYPLTERRYAPGGWIWTFFTVVCIGVFAYMGYTEKVKDVKSVAIDTVDLSIPTDGYSDGNILFISHDKWEKSKTKIVDIDLEEQEINVFKSTVDSTFSFVWSGNSPGSSHSDYMTILLQTRPMSDSLFVGEVCSTDTIIDKDQYFVDQYSYKKDSLTYLWTFSVRFDSNSRKYCAFSRCVPQTNENAEYKKSFSFLKSIAFDLTPYLKAP